MGYSDQSDWERAPRRRILIAISFIIVVLGVMVAAILSPTDNRQNVLPASAAPYAGIFSTTGEPEVYETELVFPEGTTDWYVTYQNAQVSGYNILQPTTWCLIDGEWLQCLPALVIDR